MLYTPLHIVITGPESSGKTTLANALVAALDGAILVPEFARLYLEAQGAAYTKDQFRAMAKGQMSWQKWYKNRQCRFIISDTDATVFLVWAQEKWGTVPDYLEDWARAQQPNLYLLCQPDFGWEPDPLREHPLDRERLFDTYATLLFAQSQVPTCILSGPHAERVQSALFQIRNLVTSPPE